MVKSKKKKKNKETQLTSQPANQVMRLRKTHSKEKKKNYNAQFSTNSMLKDKIKKT
jgi:hypothetical protein